MAHGRLEKWVARRTSWSRSQARRAIRTGRVAVDGVTVRDPAHNVGETACISVDGESLRSGPDVVLWHKPLGVLCTLDDPWGRSDLASAAADLLDLGLHPVGRLDADTDGLLPFSRDGRLTQHLLHPKHGIRKHYLARVEGVPDPSLSTLLAAGVRTAEGVHTAEVLRLEEDIVEILVTEGKHRMVRRMLANAGHPVRELRRLAFGALQLGDLSPGGWRPADAGELRWLDTLR